MVKGNRRSIGAMAQGAVAQQKDEQIEALREQLETIRNNGSAGICEIPIDQVIPLKIQETDDEELISQPRTFFDTERLEALKQSIMEDGLREPIIVRALPDGKYGLLDGERRWRCHSLLGKETIAASIKSDVSDAAALEWAITTVSLKETVSPLEQTIAVINLLRLRLDKSEGEVRSILYALNNSEVGNSNTFVEDSFSEIIYKVLNSLGIKLGSLVARLPLLDMPIYLRRSVMDGDLSPTNALLISRAPEELHQRLLEEGRELSKSKLSAFINRLKNEDRHSTSQALEGFPQEAKTLPEIVSDRWAAIKRSGFVKSGGDTRLTRKLEKVSQLLAEIEEYVSKKNN